MRHSERADSQHDGLNVGQTFARRLGPLLLVFHLFPSGPPEKASEDVSTRVIMREMHCEVENKVKGTLWDITI